MLDWQKTNENLLNIIKFFEDTFSVTVLLFRELDSGGSHIEDHSRQLVMTSSGRLHRHKNTNSRLIHHQLTVSKVNSDFLVLLTLTTASFRTKYRSVSVPISWSSIKIFWRRQIRRTGSSKRRTNSISNVIPRNSIRCIGIWRWNNTASDTAITERRDGTISTDGRRIWSTPGVGKIWWGWYCWVRSDFERITVERSQWIDGCARPITASISNGKWCGFWVELKQRPFCG